MTEEKSAPKDCLGLKTKRETLGLTLKDIFSLTRISVVNLEAIENGDFGNLPVPIYTRNFIKTYARALDLDGKPILDCYESYLNSLKTGPTEVPEPQPEKVPSVEKPNHYKIYAVAAAVIIIAVITIVIVSQQDKPAPEAAGNQPQIASTSPAAQVNTAINPPEQNKAVADPPAAETNKPAQVQPALPRQKDAIPAKLAPKQAVPEAGKTTPLVIGTESGILIIKATEETWLRIKSDQNPSFQVLLKPGDEIERTGASFDLDIGNAGGIVMQFKGKSIDGLGKSGQVVHLRLPQ
jgi:cytoskeleton protein RodZ